MVCAASPPPFLRCCHCGTALRQRDPEVILILHGEDPACMTDYVADLTIAFRLSIFQGYPLLKLLKAGTV